MSSELLLEAARRGQESPRAERGEAGPGRGRQGGHRRTWARSEGPPAGEACERELGAVCSSPRVVSGAALANPGPSAGGAAKEGARSEPGRRKGWKQRRNSSPGALREGREEGRGLGAWGGVRGGVRQGPRRWCRAWAGSESARDPGGSCSEWPLGAAVHLGSPELRTAPLSLAPTKDRPGGSGPTSACGALGASVGGGGRGRQRERGLQQQRLGQPRADSALCSGGRACPPLVLRAWFQPALLLSSPVAGLPLARPSLPPPWPGIFPRSPHTGAPSSPADPHLHVSPTQPLGPETQLLSSPPSPIRSQRAPGLP